MGFFNRLFGRTVRPAPTSPEAVRELLFDAVQSQNDAALIRLCAEHEALLLEHHPAWLTVPESVREEPTQLQRYAQGLIGIAQCLAQTRDRPEMLQRMMGPPAGNPVVRWQETRERANTLMRGLDFEGALALLTPEAERIQGLSGGSAESMKAMTFGQMAACHFQEGRAETALPLFRQAMELCRTASDDEGVVAYLENCFEAHRYLGQGVEAAGVAMELAVALEQGGQDSRARRIRKVAEIVRAGEPLNRVVAELDGVTLELDELPALIEGRLRFIFCRNRLDLARTTALVERGRELGGEGRYGEALALFQEARRIDVYSPEPRYEGAVTLLHLQRASEAVSWYDEVEALAPGWYRCRAERWLAAGIAAGRIPYLAFTVLRTLELPSLGTEDRLRLTRQAIGEAPGVPELQLQLARQLKALDREDEARAALEVGLAQAEEPDIRSRLLIESAADAAPSADRDKMLREAMEPGGNLVAAAMARVLLHSGTGQRLVH